MEQKSVGLSFIAMFPFEDLPAEIQLEIVSYFDIQTLSFFASTNKKHLINTLPLLLKYQKRLSTLTVSSYGMNTYYYQAQKLFVCGHNDDGQLGLGDTQHRNSFMEVKNITGKILQVTTGARHAFVLTDQGLWGCGDNSSGQLGLGDKQHCYSFTKVENISGKILQIHAGYNCTLVLTDQSLWFCGNSPWLKNNRDHKKFTEVKNISGKILQVAAGGSHTLVLTDEGLWTCGNNNSGQLGLGFNEGLGLNKVCPLTRVENIPGRILQVVAGGGHTLVLTDQKLLVCGDNHYGQLGLGLERNQNCYKLREVENIPGKILQVAAGSDYTVILTTEGMWVCGDNKYGQLGLGDTQARSLFTKVKNIPDKILQVSARDTHITVLTTQGIWACGGNIFGQLGLSNNSQSYTTLTRVENLPPEATQEKYHYMPPEAIWKIYRYISKLEDLANSITKSPAAVKPEENPISDPVQSRLNTKRIKCQIS